MITVNEFFNAQAIMQMMDMMMHQIYGHWRK